MIHVLLAAALAQGACEPNAREQIGGISGLTLDVQSHLRYERYVRAGHERLFARDPETWLPYVLYGLISDQEKVAAASLRILRDLCDRYGILDDERRNPVRFELLNSAAYRAGLYKRLLAWSKERTGAFSRDNRRTRRFEGLMAALRSGGSFDEPARPEGRAFAELKALYPGCLPLLAGYVAHEDLLIARAAVAVLNRLTGRNSPPPSETTRDAQRDEWRAWLAERGHVLPPAEEDLLPLLSDDSSDEEVAAMLRRLEAADIETRVKAGLALRATHFRHEGLLRRALETADDPEARGAIATALDEIPDLKLRALQLRDDPAWLRAALGRLRRDAPDHAAFGRRVDRLRATLEGLWTELRDIEHRRDLVRKSCDLDVPGQARWADARLEWEAFREEADPLDELKDRVDAELRALDEASMKDVEEVRREALRMIETGRRAGLATYLFAQEARFTGVEAQERFGEIRNLLLAP